MAHVGLVFGVWCLFVVGLQSGGSLRCRFGLVFDLVICPSGPEVLISDWSSIVVYLVLQVHA